MKIEKNKKNKNIFQIRKKHFSYIEYLIIFVFIIFLLIGILYFLNSSVRSRIIWVANVITVGRSEADTIFNQRMSQSADYCTYDIGSNDYEDDSHLGTYKDRNFDSTSTSQKDYYKDGKTLFSKKVQEETLEKQKEEALACYEAVLKRADFDENEHDEVRSTIIGSFLSPTDISSSPSRSSLEVGNDMEDNSPYQPSDKAKEGSNKQDVEDRNKVLNKIEKVRLMIKNEQDNIAVNYLINFKSLMEEAEFRIQNHQYEIAKDLCNKAKEEYSKWECYKKMKIIR